ncbi:hypothetical protein FCULG_00012266 [Fusarium culmorum]|uniref:Uncharacterized protein n=1 Tax=Fusarium culmorum TaxID=5516 RepID=A0A2T4GRG5_FUSCU|nr:hypothetical protein FCULG_00012266 [Fusarium culmorum]
MAFIGLENEGKAQVRQLRKPCRMFILTKSVGNRRPWKNLREQLRASQSNPSNSSQHNETNWPVPASFGTPGAVFNTLNQTNTGLNFSPVRHESSPGSINFPPATLPTFSLPAQYNHPYLPLIDEEKSPHDYYERSELLFWVIMAVAARRQKSQPTLLPRLARNITDLL